MQKSAVRDMTYIAVFAALLAICAWICVPAQPPFTMQTLGVFLAIGLLGGRRATAAIAVYLLLGAFGLPVFSGFTGGLGILLGHTGGYLAGFLLCGLAAWAAEKLPLSPFKSFLVATVPGLMLCYAFGTAWYVTVYGDLTLAGLTAALLQCVLPFLLPDALKLTLAALVCKRLEPHIKRL